MRRTYLVTIETPNNISAEVVDNYIPRALKRFAKFDEQNAFDGTTGPGIVLAERIKSIAEHDSAEESKMAHAMIERYFKTLHRLRD